MPQYRTIFETQKGEVEFGLTLREDDALSQIWDPLMDELIRKHAPLRGEGPPHAIWKNKILDVQQPLGPQGVQDGDTILIRCFYKNG